MTNKKTTTKKHRQSSEAAFKLPPLSPTLPFPAVAKSFLSFRLSVNEGGESIGSSATQLQAYPPTHDAEGEAILIEQPAHATLPARALLPHNACAVHNDAEQNWSRRCTLENESKLICWSTIMWKLPWTRFDKHGLTFKGQLWKSMSPDTAVEVVKGHFVTFDLCFLISE